MKIFKRKPERPENSVAARAFIIASAIVANLAIVVTVGMVITPLVCTGVVIIGHYFSWRGRNKKRSARGQLFLASLLVLSMGYLVIDLGAGLFGGALPQLKFAIIVFAITSFDLKSQRNLFSHLWHSLVILYVASLFAWGPEFIFFVLPWIICALGFYYFTRTDGEIINTRFSFIKHMKDGVKRRGLKVVPWVFVWLVLSSAIFVGVPRYSSRPLSVPFLVSIPLSSDSSGEVLPGALPLVGTTSPTTNSSGISLRVRGALSDEVVFRVRATAPSYWRSYTLQNYLGQSWRRASAVSRSIPSVSTYMPINDEKTNVTNTLSQTFYIEQTISPEVLASYPMKELYFASNSPLLLAPTGTVHTPAALRKGVTYTVVSEVRDTSPASLSQADPITHRNTLDNGPNLALPSSVPGRVKILADSLVQGKTTEYDKVASITSYLQNNYRYSLNTPRLPSNADAVDEFLFVDKVGFCEQFASALAVMLREEGIPSRLAVGYATGEGNSLTSTFTVRAKDAHAWVEVLFPGKGWIPFDASPGFDSEPTAHSPLKWFFSNFSTNIPFLAHRSELQSRQY